MIKSILIASLLAICIYTLYVTIFKSVKIDFDDLEKTKSQCPKCKENLYVETDGFVKMYRCKHCRFEGAKMTYVEKLVNYVRA